jgi:hypothetical protein
MFFFLSTVGALRLHSGRLQTVEVDLTNRVFKNDLPFDIKFKLKGEIDPEITRVRVTYPPFKKAFRYMEKYEKSGQANQCDGGGNVWVREGKEKYFTVIIGPLHPNTEYNFTFELFSKADSLKKDVLDIFKDKLDAALKKGVTIPNIENAQTAINNDITALLANKLTSGNIDKCSAAIRVDFKQEPYPQIIRSFVRKYNLIKNRKKAMCGLNCKLSNQNLKDIFSGLLNQPERLSPPFKQWWDKPLNFRLEGYEKTKMSEVAKLVIADNIKNVINGQARIVGNSIFPANDLDKNSIVLLIDFFIKINSKTFSNTDGKAVFEVFKNDLKEIIGYLEEIIEYSEGLVQIPSELDEFKKKLSEVLAETFIINIREIKAEVLPPVSNKQNPYLSMDFGTGFVPGLDTIFLYGGVNIYFVAVNKKGPFKIYRFWNWLLKRFCLSLGLTTGMLEEGRNRNLFKKGNVMAGCGFRIFKSFKINAGYLFFKQIHRNPLIDDEIIKARPFVSISLDIDLKPLIGKIGSIF